MSPKLVALSGGTAAGFLMAWSRLTDPAVIRDMLLLREAHAFLIMGVAILVAGIGARLLRARRARALATGELVEWTTEKAAPRHVLGSLLFGAGWSMAGTCPGPCAAMLGEGRWGGLAVALGLGLGVALQGATARRAVASRLPAELPGTAGL